MPPKVTLDTPLIPPAQVARLTGRSNEVVDESAKRLGISFTTTPAGRKLLSYRQAARIDRDIDSRAQE